MTESLTPLELFVEDVRQEVQLRAGDDAAADRLEDGFTEWVLGQLAEHNEADDAEILNHQADSHGRLPAAKLNAWALSGDGATLDLFVTLYHGGDGVPTVGLPETRRQFKLLIGFLRRAREGIHKQLENRHDVFEVARRINEANDSLATVRLFFLTDGIARVEDIEEDKLDGLELRYVLWDIKKLSQLRVGQRGYIEVDFAKEYGGAIPCLATAGGTAEYQTYLAFMPGMVLARIYGEHGQRLLERNVRAFLQAKGKVNKGLQQTLHEEPQRFLAYNNGLCCTAAEVRLETRRDGQVGLAWVQDFQIVNGGQTTASIYHAMKKERLDISQVVVQVKLTVLPTPDQIAEIVPLIAQYANSQNRVNTADLAANGTFHHQLELLSRTVWAPPVSGLASGTRWYYERARGSYLDDKARQGTPARRREWEKQNPTHQKFTKTDLAKFEHAWMGLPHLVCLGAEKNFVRFAEWLEDASKPEVNRDYFQHTVAKAILWRAAEKLFDTLDLKGYRANSVAYAVAWLAEKSGRRIDLNRIWAEQRLTVALCAALKSVCKAAWEHLNQQQGNVGEVSKKEECWGAFRRQEITLPRNWQAECAQHPFDNRRTEEETLSAAWERLRHGFLADKRTIEDLEACTGKQWVRSRRYNHVSSYAVLTWEQLRKRRGLGMKKIRNLVEMFAIAAQG
ncbi:MAG TPA: AIPR family protein [Sedimentisphaerales bacterium]|nr:AIPR family protein [Sedimentisphaerales bacterium]